MKTKYFDLIELISMIDEPNRSVCNKLFSDNKELFEKARGSNHNHQAWVGGYLDHLTEIMNIAVVLYPVLNNLRSLPFTLPDSLLVLYLHDLEKPWRYITGEDGLWSVNPDLADKKRQVGSFVEQKIKDYGFVLTNEHFNGIKYAEGEKDDYSAERRTQLPLSAFVHMCDSWSARGWFNFPLELGDFWTGAERRK